MEENDINVNWLAVIVGAVHSYGLGAVWFSPKLFGTKWLEGVGISPDDNSPMMHAMIVQALGTFGLAWIIGITAAEEKLLTAILIVLTIAFLIKANGLFAKKSMYAIHTEAGFVLAMAVIMIASHMVF